MHPKFREEIAAKFLHRREPPFGPKKSVTQLSGFLSCTRLFLVPHQREMMWSVRRSSRNAVNIRTLPLRMLACVDSQFPFDRWEISCYQQTSRQKSDGEKSPTLGVKAFSASLKLSAVNFAYARGNAISDQHQLEF